MKAVYLTALAHYWTFPTASYVNKQVKLLFCLGNNSVFLLSACTNVFDILKATFGIQHEFWWSGKVCWIHEDPMEPGVVSCAQLVSYCLWLSGSVSLFWWLNVLRCRIAKSGAEGIRPKAVPVMLRAVAESSELCFFSLGFSVSLRFVSLLLWPAAGTLQCTHCRWGVQQTQARPWWSLVTLGQSQADEATFPSMLPSGKVRIGVQVWHQACPFGK